MGSKCAQRKIGVILAFFLGIYYIRLQDIRDYLTQIFNFFVNSYVFSRTVYKYAYEVYSSLARRFFFQW